MQGLTSCHIAWLLLSGDHNEESAAHVNAALDLLEDHPASRIIALATRAQIHLRIGARPEGLSDATSAIQGLESLGWIQERESLVRVTWAEALWAIAHAQRSLTERVARIVHEELRVSFLRNVPENARNRAVGGEVVVRAVRAESDEGRRRGV